MMWLCRLTGESLGHPPPLDSKNETYVKSSGFEDFRLTREGDALSIQGGHQCAPTYSPKTVWPGLVANIGTGSCSSSVLAISASSAPWMSAENGAKTSTIPIQSEGWSNSLTTRFIDF